MRIILFVAVFTLLCLSLISFEKNLIIRNSIGCLQDNDIKIITKKSKGKGSFLRIAPIIFDSVNCVGIMTHERGDAIMSAGVSQVVLKTNSGLFFSSKDTLKNKKIIYKYLEEFQDYFSAEQNEKIKRIFIKGIVVRGFM